MASLTKTKARECPECGQIHDCGFYVEMQILTAKLDKKMNELVEYVDACEKAGLSTPEIHQIIDQDREIHPLEDK